jgi:oligoribonuclease NrnB/cAMP/cGMP phosphodiesterase (DHH superfamily)
MCMTTLLETPDMEKEGSNLKVKLFTHNDLDGIGCAIVAKRAFGANMVDVVYNKYEDIEGNVYKFLFSEAYEDFDAIFITDISIPESLAEIVDSSFAGKIQLLDHHATATWLNKYAWAKVSVMEDPLPGIKDGRGERLASGTSVFFQFLWSNGLLKDESMIDFVEQVRKWDSWEWHNVYGGETTPKQLNDLLYLIGRYEFVDRFVSNPDVMFTTAERKLLEIEQKRIDMYIKSKKDKLFEVDICGHKAGVVFAEQYHSELGNVLAEENPQYAFIALVSPEGRVSFRSSQDGIHLGEQIAVHFGGGGHEKAAGGKFDYALSQLFIKVVLKGDKNDSHA